MIKLIRSFIAGPARLLYVGAAGLLIAGCASPKPQEKVVHQRGWIGGEYKVVTSFPAAFSNAPKAAVLITALATNTPAALAGLNEGDLILELNHQPATKLRSLRRVIDHSEPGTLLPVKSWHDGQTEDHTVRAGRETYDGAFSLGVGLLILRPFKLWPDPGFSLWALGFSTEPESPRAELSSAEARYFKSCYSRDYHPLDQDWQAWLVILEAEGNTRVLSQEVVPPLTGEWTPVKAGVHSQQDGSAL